MYIFGCMTLSYTCAICLEENSWDDWHLTLANCFIHMCELKKFIVWGHIDSFYYMGIGWIILEGACWLLFLEGTIVAKDQEKYRVEVLEMVKEHNYIGSTLVTTKRHKSSEWERGGSKKKEIVREKRNNTWLSDRNKLKTIFQSSMCFGFCIWVKWELWVFSMYLNLRWVIFTTEIWGCEYDYMECIDDLWIKMNEYYWSP